MPATSSATRPHPNPLRAPTEGWSGEGTSPKSAISRRGVTLVELLVVIGILVILAAATISSVRGTLEERRVREAGRALSVYLGSARNRAIETGRPCGIMIQRFGNASPSNSFAMTVDQVEVPPPYAGESLSSAVTLQAQASGSGVVVTATFVVPNPPNQPTSSPINAALVNPGDLIQFNGQGPLFTIQSGQNLGKPNMTCPSVTTQSMDLSGGQLTPWMFYQPPNGVPYKIYRRPMKGQATPLQLPAGAVIDLDFSGTDTKMFTAADSQSSPASRPIVILFSPNGSVDRLYYEDFQPEFASMPIYLLVGKRERAGGMAADGIANWQDLHNRWITLNPQTGLLATTEIAYTQQTGTSGLAESRAYAKKFQSMGGR